MSFLPFPVRLRSHDTGSAADPATLAPATAPVSPSAPATPGPETENLNPALPDPTAPALPRGAAVPTPQDSASAQLETRHSEPETSSPRRRRWKKFVRRGRPSLLTEDVADAMYESILDCGVSDSRAGLLAHVSTSSVSRWKQVDPQFADFLETARVEFETEEIKKIRNAKRRDGQPNAQNSKWLLERTNPEVWGRRASRPPASGTRPVLPRDDAPTGAQQTHHGMDRTREPFNRDASARFVDSALEENLTANETQKAAALAYIAEVQNTRFLASQQSKSSPNIPEIQAAADDSTHRDLGGLPVASAERLAEDEAQSAAMLAYVAEVESAFLHARQQSKSSPNIPDNATPGEAVSGGIEIVGPDERAEAAGEMAVVGRTGGTPETSPKSLSTLASSASCPTPASETPPNTVSPQIVAPVLHQSRKQRRREAHLARRAASKATRVARRNDHPVIEANFAQAAPLADLVAV